MEEAQQIERIFIKMGRFNKKQKKDYSEQLDAFIEGYRAREGEKDGNIANRNNVQEHV